MFDTLNNCSAARARVGHPGEAVSAPRALSVFWPFACEDLPRRGASSHGVRARRPDRAGFTLLEVMFSVVILGLGILGLSALFAGAARQQQTSSQIVKSVVVTLNTKASLNRLLGRVEGVDPADLPEGQWAWIRSFPNVTDHALDVTTIARDAFFRIASGGAVLFEVQTFNPVTPVPQANTLDPFSHRRIIPSTLMIRVTISSMTGLPMACDFRPLNPPPDDENDVQTNPSIMLTSQSCSGTITVLTTPGNGATAFVSGLSLSVSSPDFVSKIEVLPYDWKNTKIISLNERLTYVDDPSFPPAGRRPDTGYVLFFRKLDEIAQAYVVSFSLQPLARPSRLNADDFPLVPPDNLEPDEEDALIREVEVKVGWDPVRRQYFVLVDDDNRWVAAPGQILLMSSRNGFANTPTTPGADSVVRVISQSVDPDDETLLRGYLDDAPRVRLAAVAPQTQIGAAQMLETIYVYAFNPLIENNDNANNDKSLWNVRPIDARLIPIASQ